MFATTKALPFVSLAVLGICLFFLLVSVVTEINTALFHQYKTAVNGKLDLTTVDLETSKPIQLAGEWQFFWKQFISPPNFEEEVQAPNDLVVAPFSWRNQTHLGETVTPRGYASYRLRVSVAPTDSLLSLSMPTMGTAYRLYVNKKLIDEVGHIAKNEENGEPDYSPKIVSFTAPNGEIDIVLQVSNHHFAWGGLWSHISISTIENNYKAQLTKFIRTVSVSSIFFTMAVLSLFHFSLRPSDTLPFLLALSCIILGIREVETSHILYMIDALPMSFNTIVRINFLTFYLAIAYITVYFHLSYPKEFRLWPVVFICVVSGLFSVSTIVTTPEVFSEYLYYFQIFAAGVLIYGLVAILLAAINNRVGAKLMLVGATLLVVLGLNDILFSLKLINTGVMVGLGLLSFALCQNYLTYVRFINDSKEMQSLSVKANQDPLTLLLNRRGLMDAIEQNSVEQRESSTHFCVMLIDFDHFKKLNDSLGHDVGDFVLAKGSEIMGNVVRKHDLAARWGGEEFVIFLPNTKMKGAVILAEKLRIELRDILSNQLEQEVTTSVGVAQSNANETFSECLKRADIALYSAKGNGRNCVMQAPQ